MRARTSPRKTKTCPHLTQFFRGQQLFWGGRKAKRRWKRRRREARRRRGSPTAGRSSMRTRRRMSSPPRLPRSLSRYWASHCFPWCWPYCRCDCPLQRDRSFLELPPDPSSPWGNQSRDTAEKPKDQRLLDSTQASSSFWHCHNWDPLCLHDIEFCVSWGAGAATTQMKGLRPRQRLSFHPNKDDKQILLYWGYKVAKEREESNFHNFCGRRNKFNMTSGDMW